MTIYYEDDVVSLVQNGWAVEWTARTTIESAGEDVVITQDGDSIVIPWCYVSDIIRALKEAQSDIIRTRVRKTDAT